MSLIQTIGDYQVECELGRGGMGIVYKCRKASSTQPVVVKLMLNGRGASVADLARFRIEAEALCCLNHASIVKVIDIGVADGCPYISMEFASHGTLNQYLTAHPQSVEWVVGAMRDVALAVHHAHQRKLLHRDIKPANILVMGDGSVKVSDFGLVKFTVPMEWVSECCAPPLQGELADLGYELGRFADELRFDYRDVGRGAETLIPALVRSCLKRTALHRDAIDISTIIEFVKEANQKESDAEVEGRYEKLALEGLTSPHGVLGTPQFMSPEQAGGRNNLIGPATDIYSLGATLYVLTTGRPMFTGRVLDVMVKVQNEWPISPRQLSPAIPESLDAVIWKCIQKDPVRRYKDCEALANDLQLCLEGRLPRSLAKRKMLEDRERAEQKKVADRWAKALPIPPQKDEGDQSTLKL